MALRGGDLEDSGILLMFLWRVPGRDTSMVAEKVIVWGEIWKGGGEFICGYVVFEMLVDTQV